MMMDITMLISRHIRCAIAVVALWCPLLLCGACNAQKVLHSYFIEVQNDSGRDAKSVEARFSDGSWKFEYGSVKAGLGATFTSEDLPLPAKKAVVSWTRDDGQQVERVFELPKITATEIEENVLMFVIKKDESVEVRIRKLGGK
jgi:hypothetical protein